MRSILNRLTIYLLYILTFILPVRNSIMLSDNITIGKLVGGITVISWFVLKMYEKELRSFLTIHVIFVLIIINSLIFGVIINESWSTSSLTRWSSILFSYCFAIIYWDLVRDKKTLYIIMQLFLMGFVVGGILVITEFIHIGEGRATGHLGSPNHIGALMVLGIILSVHIMNITNFKKIRYANFAFLLVLTVAMIATGSRQAFALIIISIPFLLWSIHNISDLNYSVSIITIPVLGYILASLMPWNVDRIMSLPVEVLTGDFGGRRVLWEVSFQILQDNFLTGVGLAQSNKYYESYLSFPATAHNGFLYIWVETGIVVLMLYLVMFSLLMKYIFVRNINHTLFSFAIIIVIIIRNVVSDHFAHSAIVILFITLIILSATLED